MFDFPTTPAVGEGYASGGASYLWNGVIWERGVGTAPIPPVQPTLTQLVPAEGTVDTPDLTVQVIGTEFTSTTELLWGGTSVLRTFVSATEMTVVVPLIGATAGVVQVSVRNGTLVSNELPFEYLPAVPLTPEAYMVTPDHGLTGVTIPISVAGQAFTAGCKLWISEPAQELATTFVSDTELRATMPSNVTPQSVLIWVVMDQVTTLPPTAGLTFTYEQLPLVLTSLNPPSSIVQPSIFPDVEINGSGFNSNCWVMWNDVLGLTTYVSPTKLIAGDVDHNAVATFVVTVKDQQTNVVSNALNYYVTSNQPPQLLSVSPNSAVQGNTIATLTVTGQNFVNGKRIKLAGVAVATTYVNATTLTTPNVFATYSETKIDVEVEDCPGKVAVNLTGAPGSVTISNVIPQTWPNTFNGSPYENKNGVQPGSGFTLLETDEVYIDGVLHDSWVDPKIAPGLMFQASYNGVDPGIHQYTKLTVRRGGVPSANHFVLHIGGQ